MSWNTVDARNNKLYVRIGYLLGTARYKDYMLALPIKNYGANQFAAALEATLNAADVFGPAAYFTVSHDMTDNLLTITRLDAFEFITVSMISDNDIVSGQSWDARISKHDTCSMNGILRIDKSFRATKTIPLLYCLHRSA